MLEGIAQWCSLDDVTKNDGHYENMFEVLNNKSARAKGNIRQQLERAATLSIQYAGNTKSRATRMVTGKLKWMM
ncbi:hypothetical protein MKW98_007926 [Papaver atlanticum]|uniref:Uncharacterized protein n=1 Tax=Papaver atlanticum TaxID=357466 RepID=A0AAD4XGN9_9MAGN|nr:hypothetical protein MKW98_007926 [Papaver atlanticum]